MLVLGLLPLLFTILECFQMCKMRRCFSCKQIFLTTLPALLFVSFCMYYEFHNDLFSIQA